MDEPFIFITLIILLNVVFLVVMVIATTTGRKRRKEAWGQFAERTGLTLHEGQGWFAQAYVAGTYRGQDVKLDTFVRRHGKSSTTYTRMTLNISNPHGVRLGLYRETVFSKLGRAIGMQDIEVYDTELDAHLSIKGEPQDLIQRLLMITDIRQRLLAAREVHITLEGRTLATQRTGVDLDVERLHATLELLTALAEGVKSL